MTWKRDERKRKCLGKWGRGWGAHFKLGRTKLETKERWKQELEMWVEPRYWWCSSPAQAQGKHDPVFFFFLPSHTHTHISIFTLHKHDRSHEQRTRGNTVHRKLERMIQRARSTAPNKARQTGAFILCMFILLPLLNSRGTINIDQNQTAHSYETAQKYAMHWVKWRQSCEIEEERMDWTQRQIRERRREHFKEKRERGEREAEGERGRKDVLMRGQARLVCLPPQHEERAVNER